jgi:hypothetical protein
MFKFLIKNIVCNDRMRILPLGGNRTSCEKQRFWTSSLKNLNSKKIMNTKALGISVLITTIVIPSVAIANPELLSAFVPTFYGPLACTDRAKGKLLELKTTKMGPIGPYAVGAFYDNATINIWCRGTEVVIIVAGPNAASIIQDLVSVF